MYAMGNWLAGALDGADKPKFAVGQFNWPGDADNRTVPAFTGGGLLVNAKAKNLDAARTFALAFQLDKANLDNSAVTDGLANRRRAELPVAVDLASGPVGADTPARTGRRRPLLPRFWHFAGFGGPGLAVYACFVLAPILISAGYSLTNYNPFRPPTRYVGLDNYRLLLTDEAFLTSLRVTTVLTVIVVVAPNVLGLAIAVLLDRRGWLYNALRSVFFNQALRAQGVDHPPGWLSDPGYALYSLGTIVSWQMLGFCVVVWLAGLQGGPARRFWHVSWPLLAPALTINTVVLMISAFKIFDHVQVITRGGPGEGTTATIAFVVLRTAFEENRGGIASAQAVIMLTIIAAASAVALKLLRRREVEL